MPLVIADRVLETTSTTGTGTVTLAGAVTGYQSFGTAVGDGNTTYYTIAIEGGTDWEVGIGTYTASGTTLSRDTVLASSNSGSLVSFGSGTKNVFVTYPGARAVYYQAAGGVVVTDNSSNDALRITQTGTGNALVVEDSANPDATPFVVDASGNVISGYTAFDSNWFSSGNVPRIIQVANAGSTNREGFLSISYSGSPGFSMFRATGGVVGTEGAVASGDVTGIITFAGYDGVTSGALPTAVIQSAVDGTPGTGDMPGRLIFSTTADGASTVTERMRINNAGGVGVGVATTGSAVRLSVGGTNSSDTTYSLFYGNTQASSANTVSANGFYSQVGAAATATTTDLYQFRAGQGTFTAGAAVTNQYGYRAESSLTGATNNYGFYSNIASGTGRWNFYANGTAANYFEGKVGIGGAAGDHKLAIQGSSTGATTMIGAFIGMTPQSDVTGAYRASQATLTTAAASFTLTELSGYSVYQGTIGVGSTVTNQYGFVVGSNVTGATNNYGFYSNIASGTGRWNFYANGTAANYFGGNTIINGAVGVGAAGSPSYGTSGQTLTSRGSAAAPVWSNPGIISALVFGL